MRTRLYIWNKDKAYNYEDVIYVCDWSWLCVSVCVFSVLYCVCRTPSPLIACVCFTPSYYYDNNIDGAVVWELICVCVCILLLSTFYLCECILWERRRTYCVCWLLRVSSCVTRFCACTDCQNLNLTMNIAHIYTFAACSNKATKLQKHWTSWCRVGVNDDCLWIC